MKKIILDGSSIHTIEDFYCKISDLLEFPDNFGKNLDALWDCLSGHIDTNIELIWENHKIFKEKSLIDFNQIIKIFDELKEESPEFNYLLK